MTFPLRKAQRTMRSLVAALLLVVTTQSHALSLGAEEFAASRQLSCVLAQDALGFLSEDEYADQVNEVLGNYDAEAGDVIYAKALGYFDGLMFGILERDQSAIQARLLEYSGSQACSRHVGAHYTL